MTALNTKKVLVVDDEEMIRDILNDHLSSLGAVVETAANGKDAFEKIKNNNFDILLSDVRMPGGDGVSLIRQIHAEILNEQKPKIYICSGFNDLTSKDVESLGIIKMFTKPFSLEQLTQEILKTI